MKKLFALLLAMMMLALPAMSMAASPAEMLDGAVQAGQPLRTRITMESGVIPFVEEQVAKVIKDLLDAIGIVVYQQEGESNQVNIALTFSGEEALTFYAAGKGEEVYIQSNLLGNDVFAFNKEEGQAVLDRLMEIAQESGAMSASEAAEVEQVLEDAIAQAEAQAGVEFSEEDLDLTALIDMAAEIAAKATVDENPVQPKNCDPAVKAISITLTAEDIKKAYTVIFEIIEKTPALMEGFQAGLASANAAVDGEAVTAEQFLEKAPEMIDEMVAMIQGDIPVVIYLNEKEEPVYGTIAMTMTSEGETVAMDGVYARLTMGDVATHTATLTAKDAENSGVAISVSVADSDVKTNVLVGVDSIENSAATPVLNVKVEQEREYGDVKSECETDIRLTVIDSDSGEEYSLTLEVEESAETVGEQVKYEAEADVYLLDADEELLTIKVEQETGLTAEPIITADAVRPGAMSMAEFKNMVEGFGNTASVALIGALQKLPASVLMLLMTPQ